MEEVCTCDRKCPGDIGFIEEGKIYHSACNLGRVEAIVKAAGGLDKVTEFRVWLNGNTGWIHPASEIVFEASDNQDDKPNDLMRTKIIGIREPLKNAKVKVKISAYPKSEG